MGRDLAFKVRLSSTDFPSALTGVLSNPYFHPASLGAIEAHERGDHWFLAGYAIEDFVRRFAPRAPSKPAAVEVAIANNGTNADYLRRIAGILEAGQMPTELSPFERVDERAGITVLEECGIGEQEIKRCKQWFSRYPDAVVYLYGTVNLRPPPGSATAEPWRRAFRELVEFPRAIGPVLLLLRAAREPLAKSQMEVTVTTWSDIWIVDCDNLDRLVSLADAVVEAEVGRVVDCSLTVEGPRFVASERQLRAKFSRFLECGQTGG